MATILAANPYLVEATCGQVSWQEAVRRAIREPGVLLAALDLPADLCGAPQKLQSVTDQFPLFVPWEFVARMRPKQVDDPLLRQVLATDQEAEPQSGFSSDPVGDNQAEVLPGLLKKYAGRALLVTTGACAVHCRYCFRREYPYSLVPKTPANWQPAIDYIAADTSIEEVILSGGDPLMLADSSLAWLVEQFNAMPHIARLRIHSRVPVVIPQRVCETMLDWLRSFRKQVVFVTHINHPQEIDDHLRAALQKLRQAGAMLLNQAVFLRGVNDDLFTQQSLSTHLIAAGVLPYYLHQLDQVQGAGHFEASVSEGIEIISQLRAQFSGYGVPKYVAEISGQTSKHPLA